MIEVQDIFREHGDAFLNQYSFNRAQWKAFNEVLILKSDDYFLRESRNHPGVEIYSGIQKW